MRAWRPRLLWAVLVLVLFILSLAAYSNESWPSPKGESSSRLKTRSSPVRRIPIWVVFTRAKENPLKNKLRSLLESLLGHTRSTVQLNLVTDSSSRESARDVVHNFRNVSYFSVVYHDIHVLTNPLDSIINVMRDHFSSTPGAYYSSNLFYLSIGLFKVSSTEQTHALMLDVDTVIKADIAELFSEFDKFQAEAVVGIAPELTPVYHHILYSYRSRHKNTKLGSPFSEGGFPGVNSGVLLLNLSRMRESPLYHKMLTKAALLQLTEKYSFKGHLGDQDFYTLLGLDNESSPLLHILDCGWNRQLCDWWRHHGYASTFDHFSACSSLTKIYHGNCNSRIPEND